MMARPWAKAAATMPLRPVPPPTTAAVPAPMNTNEKVPMNSARSLGVIGLDIVLSKDEIDRSAQSGLRQGTIRCGLRVAGGAGERRRPAKRAGLLRGDHLRREIDAQRLRDAGAVGGIGLGAMDDLPRDDLDRHALHRRLVVLEELVLLVGRHQPEEIARLTVIIVAVAVVVAVGIARDRKRRLAEALVLDRAVERVRLRKSIRITVSWQPHGTVGRLCVPQ